MKNLLLITSILFTSIKFFGQNYPWKKDQIMETFDLSTRIKNNVDLPIILNVGPEKNIKTAIKIEPTNSEAGIKKLKSTATNFNKNRTVVIYCGCCSFSNCPNIQPAFNTLVNMGFKSVKVLNIPEGIAPDWIAKKYPME